MCNAVSFPRKHLSAGRYAEFLEGDVQVKTEDTAEWLPASINMPLLNGDQIWVPENGRAELMFNTGQSYGLTGTATWKFSHYKENVFSAILALDVLI